MNTLFDTLTGKYTNAEVEEMIHFLQDDLCIIKL